jgi:hypothetical protein
MHYRALALCLFVCPSLLAQAPHVTDTKVVDNWEVKGQGPELLRKINGRWWTRDNREVYPPGPGGFFWTTDSKPGVVQFFHHRPCPIERAESLHLWMSEQEVEAVLGQPNRILGKGGHGFWSYYAANGTKLEVRFMGDAGLGGAEYQPVGQKSRPVASLERELNGRSIYKLLQERAGSRVAGPNRTAQSSKVMVDPVTAAPEAPPKRTVPAQALATVTEGTTREDVLSRLGEPGARYAITDDEGTRESFTYNLDSGEVVTIRLLKGKVVKVGER